MSDKPRLSKLVIATHNRKKAGEMIQILSERFPRLEILTLADFPNAPEPDETGTTYAENATIKAESSAAATGEWSLADDAGLEIEALGGKPGIHSKRFAGEDTPFSEKNLIILDLLKGVSEDKRTARFQCSVALAPPSNANPNASTPQRLNAKSCKRPNTQTFTSSCEGRIASKPSGKGGFGYDPIFFLPERNCTMADLTAEEKHQISHRGTVLRELGDDLAATFEIA
jgi:XTP/dITP diphosphohydrolase